LIVLKSDSGLSVTHCCVSELAPFFPVSAGRGCQGFAGHCPSTFLDKQLNKEPAANINGFRALTGFLEILNTRVFKKERASRCMETK
jgi:hypothetical protein